MWNKRPDKINEKKFSGVEVTVKELIALRQHAQHHPIQNNMKVLTTPGQRLTRSRGRGLEFAATREYQAGDDIRSMAWRVTARSMKPHIKIYHEERERPVWLAVDLSPNLYFGTRSMFKSVASIRQASLLGWKYLAAHERVGALIATGDKTLIFPPQSSEQHFLSILAALSQLSQLRPAFNAHNYLYELLLTLQQRARSGNLVYILSDFASFNAENQKLIAHIAERTQLRLIFIYDPLEAEAPPPYQYMVTNDEREILFNMENTQCRQHYQQQFLEKKNNINNFARKHNISFHMLRTDQAQKDEVK